MGTVFSFSLDMFFFSIYSSVLGVLVLFFG